MKWKNVGLYSVNLLWIMALGCQTLAAETDIDPVIQNADAGDPKACIEVGGRYRDGVSLPKDPKKALEYFLAAANVGDKDAQYQAGLLLSGGHGVDADLVKALMWVQLSGINTPQCSLGNLE